MAVVEISNFISIKQAKIELAPITVFIGPQAAGKSILAKLVYFFNRFPYEILTMDAEELDPPHLQKKMADLFCTIFKPYVWENSTFEISYETNLGKINVNYKKKDLLFTLKNGYEEKIQEISEKICKIKKRGISKDELLENYMDSIPLSLLNFIAEKQSKALNRKSFPLPLSFMTSKIFRDANLSSNSYDYIYIPATRSLFSVVDTNPYAFRENLLTDDYFLNEFGKIYKDCFLTFPSRNTFSREKNMQVKLPEKISQSSYRWDKIHKKRILQHSNGISSELKDASSGEQAFFPLFWVLNFSRAKKNAFIVEEPEAHLYPEAQNEVVKLLVEKVVSLKYRKSLNLITTHSPYILSALNNHILAGSLYDEVKASKKASLSKLIPEECRLPKKFCAAYLVENGEVLDIMDHETGLILAEKIDAASDNINSVFDKLLDIQYKNDEKNS